MECKEFENHIHDDFSDPNFDWRLRDEIDAHYFGCDNCFETYQVAKLMADPDIKKAAADKLADIQVQKAEGFLTKNRPEEAIICLNEALELRPGDTEIRERILLLTNVGFDDTPQKSDLFGDTIVIPIMKPTEITVEYPGDEVWRYNPQSKELFTPLTATSALQDKPEQSVPAVFETNSLIVEIHKGEAAGKLVIRLKK